MSSYKRMILVPEEEYFQLKQTPQLYHPTAEMPTHRRQLLQAVELGEQRRQLESAEKPKAAAPNLLEALGVPANYQNRARALYQLLTKKPVFKWTDYGELENYPGSNIVDLIDYAVRDRRRIGTQPHGWTYFIELLQQENIPRSLLGKPTLNELTRNTPFVWAQV